MFKDAVSEGIIKGTSSFETWNFTVTLELHDFTAVTAERRLHWCGAALLKGQIKVSGKWALTELVPQAAG